jgi:hypothetical protein
MTRMAEGACPNCRDCDCAETHVAESAALRRAEAAEAHWEDSSAYWNRRYTETEAQLAAVTAERDAAREALKSLHDRPGLSGFCHECGQNFKFHDEECSIRAALASAPQEKCGRCGGSPSGCGCEEFRHAPADHGEGEGEK